MPQALFTELDLSPSRVRGFVAGLRPYREDSPRLEVDHRGTKLIGHNYGHGGSGITMAWGSAEAILDRLAPELPPGSAVAVLGAGVMGLCTATLAQQRGLEVTIYAREFPPTLTTSSLAGGLWAPTHVGVGSSPEARVAHERLLRRSWLQYEQLDGTLYGIDKVPMFEADDRLHALDPMPEGLTGAPRRLQRLPFTGNQPPGQVWETLLVETPKFLQALFTRLLAEGGRVREFAFSEPADLDRLEEPVIVNCLGLGAARVTGDPHLRPIRGQLVLLDPAPRAFVLDHAEGYIISRRDVLILGGTFEDRVDDTTANEAVCRDILERTRKLFSS